MELLSQRLSYFWAFGRYSKNYSPNYLGQSMFLTGKNRRACFPIPSPTLSFKNCLIIPHRKKSTWIFLTNQNWKFFFSFLVRFLFSTLLFNWSFLMLSVKRNNNNKSSLSWDRVHRIYLKTFIWFQGLASIIQYWIY